MTKENSHLTEKVRCQIEVLTQEGFGVRAVARAIGRDHSVISRELKRNSPERGAYTADAAQGMAEGRRAQRRGPRKEDAAVLEAITRGLEAGWSPEQISQHHRLEDGDFVSPQWIYEAIERDRSGGGELYRKLWRRRKRGRSAPVALF